MVLALILKTRDTPRDSAVCQVYPSVVCMFAPLTVNVQTLNYSRVVMLEIKGHVLYCAHEQGGVV